MKSKSLKPVGELKTKVLSLVVDEELLKKLEDWRHERRIWSRSEAIRMILDEVLSATKGWS